MAALWAAGVGADERGGKKNKKKGPLTREERFPASRGMTHEEALEHFAPKVACFWCQRADFWQATWPGRESVVRCLGCWPQFRGAKGGREVRAARPEPLWVLTEDEFRIPPEDRRKAGEPDWRFYKGPTVRLPDRPWWSKKRPQGGPPAPAPAKMPNPLFRKRAAAR